MTLCHFDMTIYNITPTPKPRMTKRDKWAKRAPVLRYFAFKDECKFHGVKLSENGNAIVFHIPMPQSWSKKKRLEMNEEPHQSKPDIDNLVKALFDAVFEDDSCVWRIYAEKRWSETGKIDIGDL